MASPDQVIIFGASGDLTRRKLIPALARLDSDPRPPVGFSIMGVSRSDKTDEQFRMELAEAIPADLRGAFEKLAPRISYHRGDSSDPESVASLGARLDLLPGGRGSGRLFYLSLKPDLFHATVSTLGAAGLLAGLGARRGLAPGGGREALRSRSRYRASPQSRAAPDPAGGADLQDRSLPRKGDGAEPAGLSLPQRDLRAALEPSPRGAGTDHRGRDDRGRAWPWPLLRHHGCAARHAAEPHLAGVGTDRHGATGFPGRRSDSQSEGRGVARASTSRPGRGQSVLDTRPLRAGRGQRPAGVWATPTSRGLRPIPRRRPSSPCGPTSTTGAGAACPFYCATASE